MIPIFVTGTVLSVAVLTPADRMARTAIVLDTASGSIELVLPGANGGPPLAVGGVPVMEIGQTWQMELVETPAGLVPLGLGAGMDRLDAQPIYNLNGVQYDPDQLPLVFHLNDAGSADLGFDLTEQIITSALDQWTAVGCSSFAFAYGGTTDATYADDGLNVLSWEDGDTWEWGAAAIAGLTSTRFEATDDGDIRPSGADIVFNGVAWEYLDVAGDPYAGTLHTDSIVVHELGHVTGMDHELHYVTSTMYYGYIGGTWQSSLSGDDRRGLCENYPSGVDECETDSDCSGIDDQDRVCVELEGIKVCDEVRDEIGAVCSAQAYNCPEYCVFGLAFDTEGYCSVGCERNSDCPDDMICDTPANFMEDSVYAEEQVCVYGERPPDTGGDGGSADGGAGDTGDDKGDGCGCSAGPGGGVGFLLLPLFALSAIVRRTGGTAC